MKLYPRFHPRKAAALVCGIGLAAGMLAWRARADQWNKKTVITLDQPTQVTDRVLLNPGQYTFKLLDSQSNRHVVQIFSGDEDRIINTVLAVPAWRNDVTGHSVFRFWETPPGYARAMRVWYYPGDNSGQEFPYPKQLAMLENPPEAAAAPAPEPQPQQETAPAPEPTQPQAMNEESHKEETQEIAQATPPAAPEPEPQTQAPTPEALPKTSTPYPAIGLAGALLLGLYGLLRFRRLA